MEGVQLWHRYLKLQSFPKNQKILVSKFVSSLGRYIAPPLNEGDILSFGDDLSGGSIKKPTQF